jgi:predicted nucleic-acid-binding Zn-ribbon protein
MDNNVNNCNHNHTIITDDDSNKGLYEFTCKMEQFKNSIPNNKYIFEVSKLCGYSEFVLINKDESVLDFYKSVSHQFQCRDIKSLFITNGVNRIYLPITDIISIRQFITDTQKDPSLRPYICPVYPLPTQVVYRIYLDDGHSH